MDPLGAVLVGIAALLIGAGVGAYALNYYQNSQGQNRRELADKEAKTITTEAQVKAQSALKEAEERARVIVEENEQATLRRRRETDKEEERLQHRREDLDKRLERLELREQNLNKRQ